MLLLTPLKLNHLVNMIRYNEHGSTYSNVVITPVCILLLYSEIPWQAVSFKIVNSKMCCVHLQNRLDCV